MDMQEAWNQLLRLLAQERWDQVECLASDLLYELNRGARPPDLASGIPVSNVWNWAMARFGCRMAITQAREGINAGSGPEPATQQSQPTAWMQRPAWEQADRH